MPAHQPLLASLPLILLTACGLFSPVGAPDSDAAVVGGDSAPLDGGVADDGAAPDGNGGGDTIAPRPEPEPDLSDPLFRPDHVLEIEITMDPQDWAALRADPEGEQVARRTCASEQTDGEFYTYFPADITIDGVTTTQVGLRKKGGVGSRSSTRPSLKVKPGEYISDQRIASLSRLTLNNNLQDPSQINQCLGYQLFNAAGVPSPRCSFAHVVVNGEDLGIYSHVETIKKPFLRRHFDDDEGRLYESGGRFVPGWTGGFQPKTNKDMPDCSDLDPVAEALATSNGEFAGEIGALIDVDSFMSFWAMEVLMEHWDGYTNNRNNYYFYHDPTSDRMHFIPWGADQLFVGRTRNTRPASVHACSSLAWRMYDVPETQEQYLARLRQLLDTVWNEADILAEMTRMSSLVEPYLDSDLRDEMRAHIAQRQEFVYGRRSQLLAELDVGAPEWPIPRDDSGSCHVPIGEIDAVFEGEWGTIAEWGVGSGTAAGSAEGESLTYDLFSTTVGMEDGIPTIVLLIELDDGRRAGIRMRFPNADSFAPGTSELNWRDAYSFIGYYDPATDTSRRGGNIVGGAITLTAASREPGAPVRGTLSGIIVE